MRERGIRLVACPGAAHPWLLGSSKEGGTGARTYGKTYRCNPEEESHLEREREDSWWYGGLSLYSRARR